MARTHKDDLRSLGKVLYELTTGRTLDQPGDTPADLRELITGLIDGKFESAKEASKVLDPSEAGLVLRPPENPSGHPSPGRWQWFRLARLLTGISWSVALVAGHD